MTQRAERGKCCVLEVSQPYAQSRLWGLSTHCGLGLFAPSMGLTPPRYALRGQRFALSKFAPGKFVTAQARMPERTSAEPMARRARHGTCRVNEVRVREVSQPYAQSPPLGAFDTLRARIVRPIHGAHPSALRAPGPALCAVQICSWQICRTLGSSPESLPAIRTKPAFGAGFVRMAGRLGFEPR
jgi:hypothetical protein